MTRHRQIQDFDLIAITVPASQTTPVAVLLPVRETTLVNLHEMLLPPKTAQCNYVKQCFGLSSRDEVRHAENSPILERPGAPNALSSSRARAAGPEQSRTRFLGRLEIPPFLGLAKPSSQKTVGPGVLETCRKTNDFRRRLLSSASDWKIDSRPSSFSNDERRFTRLTNCQLSVE